MFTHIAKDMMGNEGIENHNPSASTRNSCALKIKKHESRYTVVTSNSRLSHRHLSTSSVRILSSLCRRQARSTQKPQTKDARKTA